MVEVEEFRHPTLANVVGQMIDLQEAGAHRVLITRGSGTKSTS